MVVDEVSNWMDAEDGEEIPSKRHLLEEDDIKISLPIDFKRMSLYDYQRRLDSVATKAQYKTCAGHTKAREKTRRENNNAREKHTREKQGAITKGAITTNA